MNAVIYIAAALSALCAVLLIIVITKLGRLSAGDGQIKELESKISSLEGQLRDEFERSRRESAGNQKDMRSELTESLDKMNERLALMTEANFKHQQQLTDMFSKSLDTIRRNNIEQNDRQSRIIAESIEKMQQSNEKKLDEMRATVDEKLSATLTTRLDSSFKTVSEQLENVYKSLGEMKELSTGVTTNVTNLNRVLTNVKARGTWAEVQLEGILDQTIPNMYVKNFSSRPGSSERVEFAIRIPAGDGGADAYLPVDSKFPLEDYVRLCTAADGADADEVAAARKALEVSAGRGKAHHKIYKRSDHHAFCHNVSGHGGALCGNRVLSQGHSRAHPARIQHHDSGADHDNRASQLPLHGLQGCGVKREGERGSPPALRCQGAV